MTIQYPQSADLRRLLRFSSEDGTIWLGESRMLLMHVAALAGLRKELIASVGLEHARRVLTRMGFASGKHDAELARKIRGGGNIIDAFLVGPQLHMLEGSVRVTPIKMDMDIGAGTFSGEFRWENSWEAEAHVKEFGPQSDPVCWMLIGYASGFTSEFMGRFVLFKESQCAACGSSHCLIEGRPVEEWPDAAEHTIYFEQESIVTRLLELHTEVDALRSTLEERHHVNNLIGISPAFQRAYDLVGKAASTQVTVLLTGETGVGKERFARALHERSPRAANPFVAVNCAALPGDLIESELFGVEKGAYTGAQASRCGRFERADGGTLFLDEIGELPLAAQAKLLRVLQEGELERLGDDRTRKVNVRIVAATNVDLQNAVKLGQFRSDLFYRLNVYPINIPPLRERQLDIPPLAKALLERFSVLHGKRIAGLTDKAMRALKQHSWPGNIRELENMIERGVILSTQDGWIELEDLFPGIDDINHAETGISQSGSLEEPTTRGRAQLCEQIFSSGMSLDAIEAMLLKKAVNLSDGNMAGAARMLGLTRPQLAYRMKQMSGDSQSFNNKG